MLFNPGVTEMAEYARSVWLATHAASQCEREAVSWMIKNRLMAIYRPDSWQGESHEMPGQVQFLPVFFHYLIGVE